MPWGLLATVFFLFSKTTFSLLIYNEFDNRLCIWKLSLCNLFEVLEYVSADRDYLQMPLFFSRKVRRVTFTCEDQRKPCGVKAKGISGSLVVAVHYLRDIIPCHRLSELFDYLFLVARGFLHNLKACLQRLHSP